MVLESLVYIGLGKIENFLEKTFIWTGTIRTDDSEH